MTRRSAWPPGLWLLLACQTVLIAGVTLAFPFFALYLNVQRGYSMGQVGLWLSAVLLATALVQPLGGEISDALGRKKVMSLSLWVRTAAVSAMVWAVWSNAPFWALISIYLASSLCASAFDPAARAWIADHVAPEERAKAYGYYRVAVNLGWALGPAAGGLLAGKSYAGLFALSALACASCAAALSWKLKDRPGLAFTRSFKPRGMFSAASDGRFFRFSLLALVIAVVAGQLVVPLSVYAKDFAGVSEARIGLLFSLNGLLVVAFQVPLTRRLSAASSATRALAWGCLLYALGYAAVGFSRGFSALASCMVVITLGEMTVAPYLSSLAANLAPDKERGRYLGFLGLMRQAGKALGPLAGGLGLEYLCPRWAPSSWLIIGGAAVFCAAGFSAFGALLRPEENGGPAAPLSPQAPPAAAPGAAAQ